MDSVTAPVRVVLVDDDQLVRVGLRMLLSGDDDVVVVGEAGDGLEAEGVIASTAPDVVLMDIRMPRCDGLVATERELRRRPDLAVLVLTTFEGDDLVLGALQAGARGFLLKDTPPHELVQAVRTVAAGDSLLAPRVTRHLVEAFVAGPQPAAPRTEVLDVLTDRERDVFLLMARGRSNGEIAAELFIAEQTVKTHVGRVLAKLQLRDRVHAVVLAYESGLVTPSA